MERFVTRDAVHPEQQEKMPSRRELNKQNQKALFVLFTGLFGAVLAESVYPLLDGSALLVLVAVLFLLPFAIHITLAVRNGLAANIGRLARPYSYCGAALIAVAAFTGLNASTSWRSVLCR